MSNSERVIRQYFELQGVQCGFLLVFSPDFNPVDNRFLELKNIDSRKILAIVHVCLKFAIPQALMKIH